MADQKNKIEVLIGGSVYTLVGEESEEYMQRVALYIDKKMANVARSERSRTLSTNMLAILTSINVADDYFKLHEFSEKLQEELQKREQEIARKEQDMDKYQQEMGKLQQENIVLRAKMEEMRLELMKARMELEEYISTFEESHKTERKSNITRLK